MTVATSSPAERRRNKIRARILSAAESVFAREGAEGLSIRRLAENIDYSPAAIYKYFSSKDELVDELKESFFELILQNVHLIADRSTPFAGRARECLATYIRVATDKPYHYAAAFAGESTSSGPVDTEPGFEVTKKGQAFNVLRNMIAEGVETGAFRSDIDPSLAAKSVWASMHGLVMMIVHIPTFPALKSGQAAMAREEFIEYHADQVIRGMEVNHG
ncbi:MAG: TetR/AcrR family transcriptional regulator [Hyphomonadaceae bacterium]|nr:TetR/AcrR family transcriptional regulator [Hyphomonadaceae bacterium]